MAGKAIDLTGQVFGRLTVSYRSGTRGRYAEWTCQCVCGQTVSVSGNDLRRGHTKSCGCLWLETMITHGMRHTPEYNIWFSMLQRCFNPKNHAYHNYGGRGITVCEQWRGRSGFQNFFKDMGFRPPGLTLERENNNLGYNKNNCKWATCLQQAHNKRNNRSITAFGLTLCLTEWARKVNKSHKTISNLLDRGHSEEWTIAHLDELRFIGG